MSELKVNKISPKTACGTTTLGDSGDTFTIPAGVTITNNGTQTGFGREGSVNWQTSSIKTSTFTATSGEGYFCNTSGGAFTVNLPAGSAGAIVSIADYTRTFADNNLTLSANGSEKIGGFTADAKLTVNGQSATFVYVDGTEGWINVQETQTSQTGLSPYVIASGGTQSTVGDFKVHTFTGPGTFTVCQAGTAAPCSGSGSNAVEYIVIGGGGSGGRGYYGGGGGAGGFRFSSPTLAPATYPAKPLSNPAGALPVSAQGYPVVVGAGGGAQPTSAKNPGSLSSFSTISSAGGGAGGNRSDPDSNQSGSDGGSGGGHSNDGSASAGSGNTPPVSPAQGTNGGGYFGGGGGGGTTAGSSDDGGGSPYGAAGGDGGGFPNAFGTSGENCGSFYYFAGGGGGGTDGTPSSNIGPTFC